MRLNCNMALQTVTCGQHCPDKGLGFGRYHKLKLRLANKSLIDGEVLEKKDVVPHIHMIRVVEKLGLADTVPRFYHHEYPSGYHK